MSKFDKSILVNLEKLCKIKCTEEEEKDLLQSLKRILDYMDLLNEVDTENVSTCNYVLKDMQKSVLREDIAKDHMSKEEFLANSPSHIGGMIRVPIVIKEQK